MTAGECGRLLTRGAVTRENRGLGHHNGLGEDVGHSENEQNGCYRARDTNDVILEEEARRMPREK